MKNGNTQGCLRCRIAWRVVVLPLVALFFVALFLVGRFSQHGVAQELDQLRNDVRTASVAPPQEPTRNQRRERTREKKSTLTFFGSQEDREDDECDEDGTLTELAGATMLAGLSSPFWGPRAMVGDENMDPGYFLRYPYLHQHDGSLVEEEYLYEGVRSWMLRVRSEYGDDFNDHSRIGGALLLDSASRWGIDSEFNYRREELVDRNDSLWIGDANLVFRFAQSDQLQMRTGIGMNWLSDVGTSDLGFNFTYSGDWFPSKPIIVSHEIDWGKLGHASLFHARLTAGMNYHRLETYIGYDYLDVGTAEIGGMVAGVRLWLSR